LSLKADQIRVDFAGVAAVDHVDLELSGGEVLGLIGPNGAGKTTLVNALTGFVRPTSGSVFVDAVNVTDWAPHRLVGLGVVRTFQGVRIFPELTVLENVEIGSLGAGGRRGRARQAALENLNRFHLLGMASRSAGTLSHGEQRRLELARVTAMRPRYLLLDEPIAGLSEAEADHLMSFIQAFRQSSGASVLIIEHDMRVIMSLCTRIQVLNFGRTMMIGKPAEVRHDADVIAAYLGGDEATEAC
jgi:branched-chain amino acid transport system ATP-binding protein